MDSEARNGNEFPVNIVIRKSPWFWNTTQIPEIRPHPMNLNKSFAKQAGIFLLFVLGFWAISSIYLSPAIGGEMALAQGDMNQVRYMTAEAKQYKEVHGEYPGWVDGLFSGMPTSLITGISSGNLVYLSGIYELFHMVHTPFNFLFLAMLSMFILLLSVGCNHWLSAAGAIGYAFMTFSISSYEAGHITKILATNVMPGVLAGLVLLGRKKYLLGAALTASFFALLVGYFHYQIAYYMGIVIAIFLITEFIRFIRTKEIRHGLMSTGIAAVCLLAGVLANLGKIVDTKDYSKASMRGGSEVYSQKPGANPEQSNTSGKGLNIKYAFEYSYGIEETFSLMFPRIKGGGMQEDIGENELTGEERVPLYFGELPILSGPIYLGVILMFLFIAAIVFVIRLKPGKISNSEVIQAKYWLVFSIITFLISASLAWGRYFGFNEFLFDNLPLYDKFRTPMMALTIAELIVPFFGLYGLSLFLKSRNTEERDISYFKVLSISVAGVCAIAGFIISTQKYESISDDDMLISYMQQENVQQFESLASEYPDFRKTVQEKGSKILTGFPQTKAFYLKLVDLRSSEAWKDFGRSLLFIGICLVLVFFYERNQLSELAISLVILFLVALDLIGVSKRYLKEDNFQAVSDEEILPSPKDQELMAGNKNYGRVYDLRGNNPFNNNYSAPFHRSIGGYHPAKISRYQDVISYCITPNGGPPTTANIYNNHALDMLNCAYILKSQGSKEEVYTRPTALGNSWFVSKLLPVKNALSAVEAINKFNPRAEAIVEQEEKVKPGKNEWTVDSNSSISISHYSLDTIEYQVQNSHDGLAVFSEIYYNEKNGQWKAFADGKEVPVLRVNYILRAAELPANTKQVKLIYYKAGNRFITVERAASGLSLVLLAAAIGMAFVKKEEEETPANA